MTENSRRSRSRRRLILLAGIVVALFVIIAVVLPLLVDPNRHRERIESLIEETSGWDAELGEIDLSVWSGFKLNVSPARLAARGDGSVAEAESIAIRAGLLSLLRGELEVRSIAVESPRIRLVRHDLQEGWILPFPQLLEDGGGASGDGDGESRVELGTVTIDDGRFELRDSAGTSPIEMALAEVDLEFDPESLRVRGSAIVGGGGALEVDGSLRATMTLRLEDLPTEHFASLGGGGLIHAGGLIDGTLTAEASQTLTADLRIRDALFLAGTRALGEARIRALVDGREHGFRLESLNVDLGGVKITGEGPLTPRLAIEIEVQEAELEAGLRAMGAAFPFPLDVAGPGRVAATARFEAGSGRGEGAGNAGDGGLAYEVEGRMSAATCRAGGPLPEARDIEARFSLDRSGRLVVTIPAGTAGGGALRGTASLTPVYPPGTLRFDGGVEGADLGGILEPLVGDRAQRIEGPSSVDADVTLDLRAEDITPAALGGRVSFAAEAVSLPGWDLVGALEKALGDRSGSLALVGGLLGKDLSGKRDRSDSGEPERKQLVDRLSGRVDLSAAPWRLQGLSLRAGDISATGVGTLDAATGTIRLRLDAVLDGDKSADLIAKSRELRYLTDESGRIAFPLTIEGPIDGPKVGVELKELLNEDAVKDKAIDLLKDFLDK